MMRPRLSKRKRFRLRRVQFRRKKLTGIKRKVVRKRASRMMARSYSRGFRKGYKAAKAEFEHQRQAGYIEGLYDGGERYVESQLPDTDMLPEHNAEQIIAAGVAQMQRHIYRLTGSPELAERLLAAMDNKTPMSIVRLGDGELLTMAQDLVMSIDDVRREGHFLKYAGVDVPDLNARDQLANAVREATVVGIPKSRKANFQPLALSVFRAHGIDYRQLNLTLSTINYNLYLDGLLSRLLSGRSVLLIGDSVPPLAEILRNHGVHVAGVISPVHGMKAIPEVMAQVPQYAFDIALVSAGVSAVVIAQRIASEFGKVALDFGHLADSIVKGEAPYR